MSHSTIPLPYEYALISQASYFDSEEALHAKHPEVLSTLQANGWRLEQSLQEGSYHGGIWVNDAKRQVVIAHRGSQNADSWVTDLESVVEGKPGSFVQAAINTLRHERVGHYVAEGYRLSTTGHSLGGFLAQVCVYWSKRPDFADSMPRLAMATNASPDVSTVSSSSSSSSRSDVSSSSSSSSSSSTSSSSPTFPSSLITRPAEVSAMVFDSPGVVDFLKQLRSRVHSHRDDIDLRTLNIHNFCAMPTVVSTYGTQTGTIWHLGGVEDIKLAFVNAHKMEHILRGFDQTTGQPIRIRQMTDWPQADYSAYSSLGRVIETTASKAIKLPFTMLNALYKKLKRSDAPTWYDRVCQAQDSEVSVTLQSPAATDSAPSLESVTAKLNLAIQGHYSAMSTEASEHRLGLHHFDQTIQDFLRDIVLARKWQLDRIGWDKTLEERYGAFAAVLRNLNILTDGARSEIVLPATYRDSAFVFQQELLLTLQSHGVMSMSEYVANEVIKTNAGIEQTKANLARLEALGIQKGDDMVRTFEEKLQGLEEKLQSAKETQVKLAGMVAESEAKGVSPFMVLVGEEAQITGGTIQGNSMIGIHLAPNPSDAELELTWKMWSSIPIERRRMVLIDKGAVITNVDIRDNRMAFVRIGGDVPSSSSSPTGVASRTSLHGTATSPTSHQQPVTSSSSSYGFQPGRPSS